MAGQGTRGSSARKKNTNTSRSRTASGRANTRQRRSDPPMDMAIRNEIMLFVLAAVALILFLCNFGVIGAVGDVISGVMFGLFGLLAYVAPLLIFLMIAFGVSNVGNNIATRKLIAGAIFFLLLGIIFEFFSTNPAQAETYQITEIYSRCSEKKQGGGVLAGSLAYLSCKLLDTVGTVLLVLVLGIVCLVIVTEKSLISGMAAGGKRVYERSREDAAWRRERADERRRAQAQKREESERERRAREEELENEKLLRMDKKVSGVMLDTALGREEEKAREEKIRDDIHEITLLDEEDDEREETTSAGAYRRPSHHYIEQETEETDEMNEISMEDETDDKAEQPMDSWQPMTGNQMKPSSGRPRAVAAKKPQMETKSGAAVRSRGGRDTYRFRERIFWMPGREKRKGFREGA